MEKLIIRKTPLLYPVRGIEYLNVDSDIDIWIKFTSYLKPDETALLEKLENKNQASGYSLTKQYENVRFCFYFFSFNLNMRDMNFFIFHI